MKLLGIEMSEKEFDYLMCEQNKGKELKVVDGKVVAVEHEVTKEELVQKELTELDNWFKWYDNQVAQYNRCQRLGIEYDRDINELDNQAKTNQERVAQLRALINN